MQKYTPKDIEEKWYKAWEENNLFAPSGRGAPFSIAIPPPNVTGSLHMGHAFQHSIVDALIRYQRMKGRKTLWQMGTDHAGIATQMLVTEQLAKDNISASELGREQFIQKVWDWKEISGNTISNQLKKLGASLHWETERFTMDKGLSNAVNEVFIKLYDEELIYRGKRLVNWDPVLKTSLSDLEVETKEEKGYLWHFKYPFDDLEDEFLVVATTRPETMLGDTAVAVNPEDERYRKYIGKVINLPITHRKIQIIADNYVDPSFGSGCVKITPAHDFNDYEIGKRHGLELINILNEDCTLNHLVPKRYEGLDRFDARKKVIEELGDLGLIEKIDEHISAIPRAERTGVIIEPYLSDQWFVSASLLAENAIKVVESGEIDFVPKNTENIYFSWMRNIEDWCISRQLWWGHQIPAWHDQEKNIYVGRSEKEVRAKYSLATTIELNRDSDVLDTWFSSALWTFSTLGWPEKTAELETFHPTSVMVTGHDIISLWVSRMIMMSLYFLDEVPFKKVYVHGLITDANGQKMSKSKGNGLDPTDIIEGISLEKLVEKRTSNLMQPKMRQKIEKNTIREYPKGISAYGTDPLRFTFQSLASGSKTVSFDVKRVEGYRNFCNKLWNAAQFVLSKLDEEDSKTILAAKTNLEVNKWIQTELQACIKAVDFAMDTFRFDLAVKAIYEFVWNEFCDWYLELTKPVLLSNESLEEEKNETKRTLITVIEAILRLIHPFAPFISEELWQKIPADYRAAGSYIMITTYPATDSTLADDLATEKILWLKETVTAIRNIRGEMDISPVRKIPIIISRGTEEDKSNLETFGLILEAMILPESITWKESKDDGPLAATAIAGTMELLVPMENLIDKESELNRLSKELAKKDKEFETIKQKLDNPNFLTKAPKAIVEKEELKKQKLEEIIKNLKHKKSLILKI
ncbi:valine--tRNA ligase [Gammaproteobacteria bacterium]|nr:valine--tRNA ligase [Gammaproteobacteria bacterium]